MSRAIFAFVGLLSLLSSCAYQPTICPAYQSAYIHDKDALRKKFSYFVNDSSPKVYAASKSRFLIIEPTTYKKKVRTLQTVEMKAVPVLVPDSLKEGYLAAETDFSMAERNVNDSTAVVRIDTLNEVKKKPEEYKITKERELLLLKYDNKRRSYWVDTLGYNSEQDNYMWYLRHVLVLPDARLAAQEAKDDKGNETKGKGKSERKKSGFFKNLFNKEKKDSVAGFEGTTSATILPGDTRPKKIKKKKEKKPVVREEDALKREEEDDGF
jgi:hypothetical protein